MPFFILVAQSYFKSCVLFWVLDLKKDNAELIKVQQEWTGVWKNAYKKGSWINSGLQIRCVTAAVQSNAKTPIDLNCTTSMTKPMKRDKIKTQKIKKK